jgi:hypothetical protein
MDELETRDWYSYFAEHEAHDHSPIYERLALAVATSDAAIERLLTLPHSKRQPNLLFASVRRLGGPVNSPVDFLDWTLEHWDELAQTMSMRLTQTNEPGRQATLLPILATLPGPLALLEVGASAGLCLYPDRWQYDYAGTRIGDPTRPQLRCTPHGPVPLPTAVPEIVWRAGIDLNPLDVTNPDDVAWLEALVWPEQNERLDRLRSAVQIARADPPLLVAGHLNERLVLLANQAPAHATLVVFHSAVLTYIPLQEREIFVDLVTKLPGHWISNEGPSVLPDVAALVPAGTADSQNRFLTALDGRPVSYSGPHGQSVEAI